MKSISRIAFAAGIIVAATWSQTITSSLEGIVKDPSGAAIPQATASILNTGTNAAVQVRTDTQGRFLAPNLPPGAYAVAIEAQGFKKAVRKDLALQVAQAARIEITLEVGSVSDSMTVTGEAPLLDPTTSSIGHVIDKSTIVNLPLNQRNPFSLILLVPGTTGSVGNDPVGGNFSVNGGRQGANDILLDGVSSTPLSDDSNRLTIFPSVDAVDEFRVQTHNYSAEFGSSGGGIINLIYKSGTNQIHGSTFEFLRNSVLDSNSFFSNRNGVPLASFKRNQFGASAGGPVEIPKLYHGRNKTFFFVDYEGLRQRSGSGLTTTVPTQLQRSGDFSQTFNSAGQLIPLYDPTTTTNQNGTFNRLPVAANKIPQSLINPVALKVAQFYPLPNRPGDPNSGSNNYYSAASGQQNNDQYDIKLDHNLTDSQRFSVRWSRRHQESDPAHYLPENLIAAQGNTASGLGTITPYTNSNAVLNYDLTASPTLYFNLRYGFSRTYRNTSVLGEGFDPTQLGLPAYLAASADRLMMPSFSPAGYFSVGNGGQAGVGPTALDAHSLQGSGMRVSPKHSLKFGIDIRLYRNNTTQSGDTTGTFSFARTMTAGPNPNAASANSTGDGFASMLFGYGSGDMIRNYKSASTQSMYYAPYINDDWRVTQKLTLNFGLRYDLTIPRHERYNRGVNLDPLVTNPLAGPSGLTNLKGGVEYLGVNGWPTEQFETKWKSFAPRFGFAYQLRPDTVVRGAYGIFFAPPTSSAAQTIAQPGYTSTTPYYGTLDGQTPHDSISNPFPNGYMPINGSAGGINVLLGQGVQAPLRNQRTPYFENWNFGLQRDVKGIVIDASYVGAHGMFLASNGMGNLDQIPTADLSLGSQLTQNVANPFYGLIPSGTLSGKTVQQKYLLRPFPEFDGFRDLNPNIASSIYHSFQLKAEKRFSAGLSFIVAYTFSKSIDTASNNGNNFGGASSNQNAYAYGSERSLSTFDAPQRLVVSSVYQLPFGRGKKLGTNWNRPVNALLGGWQLNGILTLQSGNPILLTATNNCNCFNDGERPNYVYGQTIEIGGSVESRLNQYFNTKAFSQPAAYTFGNVGRTMPNLRAPGIRNLDLSMFKNFQPIEKLTLQFRAEAFNLTNTPQFSAPNGSLASTSFGVVSGTANSPRQVQFGLKVLF